MDDVPAISDLPPMDPPVTVVGDVHLSEEAPEVRARFVAFLEGLRGRGGTLVLLGDLFDWWVGGRQQYEPAQREVVRALREVAASGVRLCFQPGNRDFAFRGLRGVPIDLWPDVVRTTWGSRRVLLTHGDLLVSGDLAYLRMRARLRSWRSRVLFRIVPYPMRVAGARLLRRASTREVAAKDRRLLDIDYGLARRWLEVAEAEVLVAGHVHTGVHHRLGADPTREVLVLKDWDRRGGVVRFDGARVCLVPA